MWGWFGPSEDTFISKALRYHTLGVVHASPVDVIWIHGIIIYLVQVTERVHDRQEVSQAASHDGLQLPSSPWYGEGL